MRPSLFVEATTACRRARYIPVTLFRAHLSVGQPVAMSPSPVLIIATSILTPLLDTS